MIGTWTPPGAIFTVAFDDEKLTLDLVKRTEIPHDEPISWMTFDVSLGHPCKLDEAVAHHSPACPQEHLRRRHEEVVELLSQEPDRDRPRGISPHGP